MIQWSYSMQRITYVQSKQVNQERECLQSQAYYLHPRDLEVEELLKALGWILHQICHPWQPIQEEDEGSKIRMTIERQYRQK